MKKGVFCYAMASLCIVSVMSSCDDDDDMIIKGNLNGQGDETLGWFNPTTGTWTDTEPTE